jgi:uncharacterized protein
MWGAMIALRTTDDGVCLPVYVQPGAARERLCGEHDGRLKVAVHAAPEKGKANKAVCRLLADSVGVSKSRVHVVAGLTSRQKEVLFERVSPDALVSIIGTA